MSRAIGGAIGGFKAPTVMGGSGNLSELLAIIPDLIVRARKDGYWSKVETMLKVSFR